MKLTQDEISGQDWSCIRECVISCGKYLLERRGERQEFEVMGTQVKARIDREVENRILDCISSMAEVNSFVSEENEESHSRYKRDRYWLIDPIDGTSSYINGYDGFVVQLCLMRDGEPSLAIIYAPALDQLYEACRDRGGYLNGHCIDSSRVNTYPRVVDNYPEPRGIAKYVVEQLPKCNYDECGSFGLKLCRVASKRSNIFVKDVIARTWDVGPGLLLNGECGGITTDLEGNEISFVDGTVLEKGLLAGTDGNMHRKVMALLSERSG